MRRERQYDSLLDRIILNTRMGDTLTHANEPCWYWIRKTSRQGYPEMQTRWKSGPRKGKQRTVRVHREMVRLWTGRTVRKDYVVKHLCNNPSCCNPAHLQGGTYKSNTRQMINDGRHYTPFKKSASPSPGCQVPKMRRDRQRSHRLPLQSQNCVDLSQA